MVLRPLHVVKVHAISNCSNPTAALSPHERREPALHCDIEPCSPSVDAQHLEGSCMTIQLQLTEIEGLEEPLDEAVSRLADADAGGTCRLLHPGSEIGRADDRRVVHPEVVADLADDHRPRLTTRG
jgi:hypothetical protein